MMSEVGVYNVMRYIALSCNCITVGEHLDIYTSLLYKLVNNSYTQIVDYVPCSLFVCGISLTSGQLIAELFPD